MGKKPVRSPLSPEADQARRNLRRLWDIARYQRGLTQADICRETGWSQGVVSNYLRGEISLNPRAVDSFAVFLGVSPDEIWPGLIKSRSVDPDSIPPEVIRLARDICQLAPEDMQVVLRVARQFSPVPAKESK